MAISKKPRAILKTNSSGFKLCRNLLVRSMFITDQFSQKKRPVANFCVTVGLRLDQAQS